LNKFKRSSPSFLKTKHSKQTNKQTKPTNQQANKTNQQANKRNKPKCHTYFLAPEKSIPDGSVAAGGSSGILPIMFFLSTETPKQS